MKRNLIRRLWPALLLLFPPGHATGQTDILEGGHVVIASGATLTSKVTIRIKAGGALLNDGMVCVRNDLVNENAGPQELGPGIFNFCGNMGQLLAGENILGGMIMDNPAGLSLTGNTQVLGLLTLTSGRIALGPFHLTLGPEALVAGNPSAAAMVVATSTGEFRKSFAGPGTFLFPVGDADGVPGYSPVTITFATGQGAFPPGNYVGVTLANTVWPDPGITGDYLNRYWNLSHAGLAGFSATAWFTYCDEDIAGDEEGLSCTRVSPLPWSTYEPANITDNILMATGITYFSQGGGVSSFTGLGNSTIPGSQQLTNVIVAAGTSRCYAATQVLTVAGNGSMFLVMNGGAVDLTAGGMISFQPSSVVNHGGYLHAWISPGGPFCGTPMNPLVSGFPSPDAPSWAQEPSRDPFLRIYPNPAEEMVFIELTRTGSTGFTLEIYHTNGMRVMTRHCSGETKTGVSLTGWPAGIYVVCVRSEERSGYAKIVRQQP